MRKRMIKRHKRIKNRGIAEKRSKEAAEKITKKSVEAEETAKENGPETEAENRSLACFSQGALMETDHSQNEEQGDEGADIEHFYDDREESAVSRGKGDMLRLVCGFVVIFSLLSAVVLTCFSFAIATKYSENDNFADVDAEVGTEADSESGKVIFVRPIGDGDGVLTAPEIYGKCVKSTVSVSVELSDGGASKGGIGSGFIVSEDGYIVTAEHVISGAEEIWVVLFDGSKYRAELCSGDKTSDIALLKIEAEGLSAVEFGASSELIAGERIYTIGTPAAIEYAGTLGTGQISAPQRLVPVYADGVELLEKKLKLIQINVETGKGSSGCPLLDEYGRVVGMVLKDNLKYFSFFFI